MYYNTTNEITFKDNQMVLLNIILIMVATSLAYMLVFATILISWLVDFIKNPEIELLELPENLK